MISQNEHIYDHNGKRDASPYSDPTANVLALVKAAVDRIDDLQKAEMRHMEDRLTDHISHTKELALAESKRIDNIRSVDVSAVARAEERAINQAQALAKQVVESAETLRNLVSTTATTVASQLSGIHLQLSERITELEKSSFEVVGRGKLSVPLMVSMGVIFGGLVAFLIQMVLTHMIK